jgi:hypothetical protein
MTGMAKASGDECEHFSQYTHTTTLLDAGRPASVAG